MPRDDSDVEIVNIDEDLSKFTYDVGGFSRFVDSVDREERRKDIFHFIRHVLAIILILPFVLIMLNCHVFLWNSSVNCNTPESYIALVSAVIGFYFGRNFR